MDKIDLKIKNILSQNLTEPADFEEKIRHSLDNEKQQKHKFFIFNPIPLVAASLLLFSGIALAVNLTTSTPEKVWEDPKPKEIVEEKLLSPTITDEELEEVLPENEIEQEAKEVLVACGYSPDIIEAIELHRNYADDIKSLYFIYTNAQNKTKGIYITINPKNGELQGIQNSDYLLLQDQLTEISEDEAISRAKDIITSLGYSLDGSSIDSVKQLEETNNLAWYVILNNEDINDYKKFSVSFGVIDNQTIVRTIRILKTVKPDDNPYVITEEEAIQIALSKEQEFSELEIRSATAKKSREKINMAIYCLENDIRDTTNLQLNPRVRNVWKVRIEHDGGPSEEIEGLDNFERFKKYEHKIYFVDATTGEIIGGGSIVLDSISTY